MGQEESLGQGELSGATSSVCTPNAKAPVRGAFVRSGQDSNLRPSAMAPGRGLAGPMWGGLGHSLG
jgi:hypothetical protein